MILKVVRRRNRGGVRPAIARFRRQQGLDIFSRIVPGRNDDLTGFPQEFVAWASARTGNNFFRTFVYENLLSNGSRRPTIIARSASGSGLRSRVEATGALRSCHGQVPYLH